MSTTTAPSQLLAGATAAVISALRTLDWRQLRILDKRTLATHPVTLQTIGDEVARTRERVRQLERDALRHLRAQLADNPYCTDLIAEARHLIDPAATLEFLEDQVEGFSDRAAPLNASVGRLLLVLDGVAVGERWAALPDLKQAQAYTATLLTQSANDHGAMLLEDAVQLLPTMPPSDAVEWIREAGASTAGSYVMASSASQRDIAAGILSLVRKPMTPEELMEQVPAARWSVRSFRQRMQADDRFIRTAKNTYALAEWGLEEYTTAVDAIGRALDQAGGSMPLAQLQEELPARFGISKSSVLAYAGDNFHFQLHGGVVTRVETPSPKSEGRRARRVYRRPNAWVHRLEVNSEHMRGSGFPVPTSLATAVGMRPTERQDRPTPLGKTIAMTWRRQVELGSIRPLLLHYGLDVGDQVFLVLGDDGSFDVEPVRGTSALELMGAGTIGANNPWPRVAAALGQAGTEADPTELVRTLVLDGDNDVVAVLPTTGIDLFSKPMAWTPMANTMLLQGASLKEAAKAVGMSRQAVRKRLLKSAGHPVTERAARAA